MTMPHSPILRAACAAGLMLAVAGVFAQSGDKSAERVARRTQLQMQNLQQQVQDAQAAKAKVEADKLSLDKQLAERSKELAQVKGALPRVSQSLKAAEAERARLAAAVAALEKELAEQKRASDEALTAKTRELARFATLRDEQQAQAKARLDAQTTEIGECGTRNERLIRLNAELLDRYRNKAAANVLEPMLGFGDVEMFNLVQEYRDKADAERYSPSTKR